MIIQETKLVVEHIDAETPTEKYVDGYFLTIHDLIQLVRDREQHRIFVPISDKSYIEEWLKNHKQIV